MVSRKIVLRFPRESWDKPVVCGLSRDFDLVFSILKAEVTPKEEGLLVLELSGKEGQYRKGIKYLKDQGVTVQRLAKDVVRNDKVCTHCGACIAVCPTEALEVDRESWEVRFDPTKCIGCELCIPACPPHAMEMQF